MPSEDPVCQSVRAALEHDPRVNMHRHPIQLSCERGVLTMEGELGDVAEKKVALELAAATSGVDGIVDRLHVTPASPMGDGEIRARLCAMLLEECALENCAIRYVERGQVHDLRKGSPELSGWIEVRVEQGVVTLDGDVPSLAQKRLAGAFAWWIPGTRDVVNGLGVVPPEQDSDDEIVDATRLVLERDPFLDATRIHVTSEGAVVTLSGTVSSPAQAQMAERDAWCIFGVDRVVPRLVVVR